VPTGIEYQKEITPRPVDPIDANVRVDIPREVVILNQRFGKQFSAYASQDVDRGRRSGKGSILDGKVNLTVGNRST
jgi:hypothetical protein